MKLHGPSLKRRLDKPTLLRLYEVSGLSSTEIGERYGVSASQIIRLMSEYEIPRRERGPGRR
jgi:transposase